MCPGLHGGHETSLSHSHPVTPTDRVSKWLKRSQPHSAAHVKGGMGGDAEASKVRLGLQGRARNVESTAGLEQEGAMESCFFSLGVLAT